MEYKILILEKLNDGVIYTHTFPIDSFSVEEAKRFRLMHFHSDCIFIVEYCIN